MTATALRSPTTKIDQTSNQYLDRKKKREAFRQDGIKAWNEFQATGLHVTSEEADTWLARLEAGEDVKPPECHG